MGEKVGAVLVLGGGIAGIQASLDLADCGFKVFLVDESTSIGGTMAQLDKTFPTNDCSMCILAPKLVGAGRNPNIELITNSELKQVRGKAGNFEVEIRKHPRFVDEDKCNGCGICAQNCPVEAPNEFDVNIGIRKAIYVPFPQAVPLKYSIDYEHCIKCGLCERLCRVDAIDLDQKEELIKIQVGSIILAPGFEEFDPRLKSEYGYGRYTNVVTSIEFERILSASGPFGGKIVRPYDGKIPKKIAFVQCVGSRDAKVGNNYCSAACCMYSIKEAVIAREHNPNIQCTIFYMDIRSYGKDFELYYNRAKEEHNIEFIRSRVASLSAFPDSGEVKVKYVVNENPVEEEFDLVVLAVGMQPPKKGKELAKILRVQLNEYGFCDTSEFAPFETSKAGIFVCGAFAGPKDIPESVSQASGAAIKATKIIASEKWKLTKTKEYPPQRDVSKEEKRIGVFICHCGINIGGVVNVLEVTDYAKTLPNVVHAEHNLYTCSQDTQKTIREKIKEHDLNRVVVASCTPRTHEPLFRETMREAGLNEYLFEMANIRDQCSWVHMHEKAKATAKAKNLIRSIIAKANMLKPLPKPTINVLPIGLVIGGGIAGMTASLDLAEQGFKVNLVEKDKELGGHLRHIYYSLGPEDPQEQMKLLIDKVTKNKLINVYLNTEIIDVNGYVGNFRTTLQCDGEDKEIQSGVIIVATGAVEYKPTEYFYENNDNVITQSELEERLFKGRLNAKTVVMIQCVGSRNENNPNCSRICCTQAIKNALQIKRLNPEVEMYILYKDIRTYGFVEEAYRKAASEGVIFICYNNDEKIDLTQDDRQLKIRVWDPIVEAWIPIEPDIVVLSSGIIPNPDNERIAKMLKIPLTRDRFFLEAHMKLRPVDFATEGVFLCGLAHSPKRIEESLAQASAAASRASTILSKQQIEVEGAISNVKEELCSGCRICESLCEYNAIEMIEESGKKRAKVLEALCKGCGVCGSACPTGAISMFHFTDEQILAQIRALLKEV